MKAERFCRVFWYNYTMKTTSKEEIINFLKDIKDAFAKKGVLMVGLFGSFAKDNENVYSDIDIAIKKIKISFRKIMLQVF